MKRFFVITMIFCAACIASCNKDDDGGIIQNIQNDQELFSLMDGSIVINNHPDIRITSLNKFPTGVATNHLSGLKRMGVDGTAEDEMGDELRGNNYRFKLVAEMSTLKIDGVEVQATHVKITDDGYALVSYNEKGDPHRGGVVVYKFTVHDGTLENVKVDVQYVSSIEMKKAELSALDYYNGKLYMTGASSDPNFGYHYRNDGYNYAFFMVMELSSDMKFKNIDPEAVVMLTSFQGTSIRVHKDRIYVTTGDGTEGTDGGLYIYDANDYTFVGSILGKDHARSVDADDSNIFLMQAEPARITKFDPDGNNETVIYRTTDESMQKDAKSEILAWDQYLFVSENESGLRMLLKENGDVNEALDRPGKDPENEVTNSVSMNSDVKKNYNGKDVASNLLLVANGGKGVYWYDIMKDANGNDRIVPCKDNSILAGESANFIESRGNIVFVADGLGGLKVLYIGFNKGEELVPVGEACTEFMSFMNPWGGVNSLIPESKSVFRSGADKIIKDLFSDPANVPDYIEVINNTDLYINYMGEFAGFDNALGYFVIPAAIEKTNEAECAYYNTMIKPYLYNEVNGDKVLKEEYIVFKNIADGPLTPGATYRMGNAMFQAGDRIVLFIVPDGWISQNNYVKLSFSGWNQLFFTHKGMNTDTEVTYDGDYDKYGFSGVQYNTFYSDECNCMVMFFEDKHSGSDTDFNDVIISISDNIEGNDVVNFVKPEYSIKTTNGKPELVN